MFRAPDDIDWFHNGNIIDQKDKQWGGRLKIYKRIQDVPGRMLISELIIEKSTLEDRGMYVCRSSENEASSFPVSILDSKYGSGIHTFFFYWQTNDLHFCNYWTSYVNIYKHFINTYEQFVLDTQLVCLCCAHGLAYIASTLFS